MCFVSIRHLRNGRYSYHLHHPLLLHQLLNRMKIAVFLACLTLTCCSNVTVSPSSSCNQPCGSAVNGTTIDLALGGISSGDYLQIQPGCHCVQKFNLVRNVSDISLIGNGAGVQITCAPGLGLAFLNVTRLTLQGLTITGCGLNDTYAAYFYSGANTLIDLSAPLPQVNVAVVIVGCADVVMDNMTMLRTAEGLCLVGINVAGQSSFTNNVFSFIGVKKACSYNSDISIQGGVMLLYVDYAASDYNPSVQMNIENCTFANNSYCGSKAYLIQLAYRYRLVNNSVINPYLVGVGGGLTFNLAQKGYSVNVNANKCVFEKNVAVYGSVASVYWYAGLQDSHVQFTNCTLKDNGVDGVDVSIVEQGVIGLVKDIVIPSSTYRPSYVLNRPNTVTILGTTFLNNVGIGVSIQSFYAMPSSILDHVTVDSCRFERNKAIAGSAIYALERKRHGLEEGTSLFVNNCIFDHNEVQGLTSAVVQVFSMNLTIKDSSFLNSKGTAIASIDSVITLEGEVEFINNAALLEGGALRMESIPFLLVRKNSSISFINNSAPLYGGAMYVDYTFGNLLIGFTRYTCFLYFESINVLCSELNSCPDISNVGVNMTFKNNTAYLGGNFYGVSFEGCPWAMQFIQLNRSVLEVMYEQSTIFHFDQRPNTSALVSTPTNTLEVENISVFSYMPGQQFKLRLKALDLYNHAVPAVATAQSLSTRLSPQLGDSGYILTAANSYLNTSVRVYGNWSDTINVTVYSLDTFVQSNLAISIHLTECLFGFEYNEMLGDCQCSNATNSSGVGCDGKLKVFDVTPDWWFGAGPDGMGVVYKRCLFDYCADLSRLVQPQALDKQCAYNRTGLLCGGCQDGYSAVFGTNKCMKCTDNTLGLLVFFAAVGIGIIAFLLYFNITLPDGYISGVVLYANLCSLFVPYFVEIFKLNPLPPLQILNLGVGFETCFYDGMTPLARAGLGLVFPAYLFILMVLFIFLASRSLRLSEYLAKSNFTPSKLVATLIVLSYNSITQSCFQILGVFDVIIFQEDGGNHKMYVWATDPSIGYFSYPHSVLCIIAVVLVAVYLIPLPIILILPSCTTRFPSFINHFVQKMKPQYDAFFSPYKDSCTFWIGLSLLLRVLLNMIYSFAVSYQAGVFVFISVIVAMFLYALLEPYKKHSHNAIHAYFFADVLILITIYLCHKLNPNETMAVFTALAYITLGIAYLVILLVLLWHMHPKLFGLFMSLKSKLKGHVKPEGPGGEPDHLPHVMELHVKGEQTDKPKPKPPKFSELREPIMDEGYLNVECRP